MLRLVPRLVVSALLSSVGHGQLPSTLQPPAGQRAVLTVQGRGSQVYGCRAVSAGFQWVFQAPAARLFDAQGNEVGTHGDGPVWNLQDSSSISGLPVAAVPSPDQGSVPWLLLQGVNPQRTGVLTGVRFITRTETKGGAAPVEGCDAAHEGLLARVPYTATYTFYAAGPAPQ